MLTKEYLLINLKQTVFPGFMLRCAMKGPGPYRASEVLLAVEQVYACRLGHLSVNR